MDRIDRNQEGEEVMTLAEKVSELIKTDKAVANNMGYAQAMNDIWDVMANAPKCIDKRKYYFMKLEEEAEDYMLQCRSAVENEIWSEDGKDVDMTNYTKAKCKHNLMVRLYLIARDGYRG